MIVNDVYDLLVGSTYDEHAINANEFILQPHQTIPKYYLLSNSSTNGLILHYSMGSGKTATAVFAALHKYNIALKSSYVSRRFGRKNDKKSNVLVVGGWQTIAQFEKELFRPEFNVVQRDVIRKINKLMSSPLETKRAEGEELRRQHLARIRRHISFMGYQALFNTVFENISIQQDIRTLESDYQNGKLVVSPAFIDKYQNSLIIIDEMQNLYNIQGMNTYGFTVKCLMSSHGVPGAKFLFLSGTMINNSLHESIYIHNIIDDDTLTVDQYFTISDNVYKLKPERKQSLIDMFNTRFLYFSTSQNEARPDIVPLDRSPVWYPLKANTLKQQHDIRLIQSDIRMLTYPQRPLYPTEIHVGNRHLQYQQSAMLLYSVELTGYQAKAYKHYIATHTNDNTFDEDPTNDNFFAIQDAYVPPPEEWAKHGIYSIDSTTLGGKFLDLSVLRKYSAIGYEMCVLCLKNAYNGEKTIVYHDKINSFGVKQYGFILQYNGMIRYGNTPTNGSRCRNCQRQFDEHQLPGEEKVKQGICAEFQPIYYDILYGELTQSERDHLVNNVYNNPNNLYGEIISVLIISDVAYSGVSFFNTNNLIILSRVVNISKWRQICARIIRTKSHSLLPPEKQYAKIYTMVVAHPNEVSADMSVGDRYYYYRLIANTDTTAFLTELSNQCIGHKLLAEPKNYRYSDDEEKALSRLFLDDVSDELKLVLYRLFNDDGTRIWKWNTLIKRLRSNKDQLTYLSLRSLPTEVFSYYVTRSSDLAISIIRNEKYVVYVHSQPLVYSPATVTFKAIKSIKTDALNKLLTQLSTETKVTEICKILEQIIKNVNGNYKLLVNATVFWDAMYNINNEYYPDDEANFLKNRITRSKALFTGCYYKNSIILMDGTSKSIKYAIINPKPKTDLPYLFKISSMSLSTSAPFYLHLSIVRTVTKTVSDRRRITKGMLCTSFPVAELYKYIPADGESMLRKQYCQHLFHTVCEMQLADNEHKFVSTPFELF